jgi:hypothetical protein
MSNLLVRRVGPTAPAILNASFWRIAMNSGSDRIRALDDHLHKHPTSDIAILTPGIAALGQEAADRIIKTIVTFDDFCHANDPREDHDNGSFEAEGRTILFKIDHYERLLESATPDQADQIDRIRVITARLVEDN